MQKGRNFSLRAIVSTLVGEGADSLIFFFIAFYGVISNYDLGILMLTQTGMKTAYEIVVLPLTNRIVKWVKKIEGVDIYDDDISYNPFKIKDI